jgi:peroxin-7
MEILTLDWNKYMENVVITGSVDRNIKMWDLRNPMRPLGGNCFIFLVLTCAEFSGHAYAVRKVRCSPHHRNLFASVSYDRNFCLWDFERPGDPLVEKSEHHSEFAVGVDFNIFVEGQVATAGWDCNVALWQLGGDPRR